LFERFFRGEVGQQSHAPGTGLGLAIAKEIVDLHHGWIEVESSGLSGQGAAFSVWLPIQAETQS
jgi:signal transduction histidine kinase